MVKDKYEQADIAGLTPREQLKKIEPKTHDFVAKQYNTYKSGLLPALNTIGLHIIERHEDLSEDEGEFVDKYFSEYVYPVLTPMAVDSSRPFPLIRNKSLNIGALLNKKPSSRKKPDDDWEGQYINGKPIDEEINDEEEDPDFAMVQVPSVLPRIVEIGGGDIRKSNPA